MEDSAMLVAKITWTQCNECQYPNQGSGRVHFHVKRPWRQYGFSKLSCCSHMISSSPKAFKKRRFLTVSYSFLQCLIPTCQEDQSFVPSSPWPFPLVQVERLPSVLPLAPGNPMRWDEILGKTGLFLRIQLGIFVDWPLRMEELRRVVASTWLESCQVCDDVTSTLKGIGTKEYQSANNKKSWKNKKRVNYQTRREPWKVSHQSRRNHQESLGLSENTKSPYVNHPTATMPVSGAWSPCTGSTCYPPHNGSGKKMSQEIGIKRIPY